MKEQAVYVGVDVAKASLEVAWAGPSRRVANDVLGRNALVKPLGQIAGEVQVICEASAGYERGLVQALQRSGIKISLVQASRVRQYARASGILAKTDSRDAHLLCRFGPKRPRHLSRSKINCVNWKLSAGLWAVSWWRNKIAALN
jgi:transposase